MRIYLLVRIHFIIVMIRRTGLAPWEFEFPLPGSLIGGWVPSPRGQLRGRARKVVGEDLGEDVVAVCLLVRFGLICLGLICLGLVCLGLGFRVSGVGFMVEG